LKEFIDSRLSNTNDSSALGVKFAQLRQLQGKKNKKNVDTRASKGRKIRYHVHEKIQNYMAPEPCLGAWHEEKSMELFTSLFGGKKSTSNEMSDETASFQDNLVTDGFKLLWNTGR
jgi:protein AATF/BFR2